MPAIAKAASAVEKHEWIENLRNVEALIQILYDIGFLKSRGQGKVWQSARHPDFNIALAEEFSVHPAFRRYLRIGHRRWQFAKSLRKRNHEMQRSP